MAITAADVKKLREMTGAGMMDCKKALTETDGDFDNKPYILKAPADETPIDINQIIAFYKTVKMTPSDIRNSIQDLSWKCQMEHVINSI